jgi:hypothetical protein
MRGEKGLGIPWKGWWARQDSNLGPMDYESTALTTELRARDGDRDYFISPWAAAGRGCDESLARAFCRRGQGFAGAGGGFFT